MYLKCYQRIILLCHASYEHSYHAKMEKKTCTHVEYLICTTKYTCRYNDIYMTKLPHLFLSHLFRPPFINGRPQDSDSVFGENPLTPVFGEFSSVFLGRHFGCRPLDPTLDIWSNFVKKRKHFPSFCKTRVPKVY